MSKSNGMPKRGFRKYGPVSAALAVDPTTPTTEAEAELLRKGAAFAREWMEQCRKRDAYLFRSLNQIRLLAKRKGVPVDDEPVEFGTHRQAVAPPIVNIQIGSDFTADQQRFVANALVQALDLIGETVTTVEQNSDDHGTLIAVADSLATLRKMLWSARWELGICGGDVVAKEAV